MKQTKPILHGRDHEHGGADVTRVVWESVGAGGGTLSDSMPFSVSGALTVANGILRWYPQNPGAVALIHLAVGTAPTGSGVTVRVNKNGTSVGAATVSAGTNTATFVPSPATFTAGDYFTVDITAVGSTTPGSGLVVQLNVSI